MKINPLKSAVQENKKRGGVTLLSLMCLLLFAFTPGAGQVKKHKLITALQLGDAAEGARVTIVSDSALNDYEAFRRGDRFYVKIPLAEVGSALPHLRADGFEGVQVQEVGDGVVASFKLQPGATARVDQRSNRLDVIFSSPNRRLRDNTGNTTESVLSTSTFREETVTKDSSTASGRAPHNSRVQSSADVDGNKVASNQSTTSNDATAVPAPGVSPSSALASSISTGYPAFTAAPAAAPETSPAADSSGSVNSKTRSKALLPWISANRLATLLAGLVLLSLIFYLARAWRRAKTYRSQANVQANYSSGEDFDELVSADQATSLAASNLPQDTV